VGLALSVPVDSDTAQESLGVLSLRDVLRILDCAQFCARPPW